MGTIIVDGADSNTRSTCNGDRQDPECDKDRQHNRRGYEFFTVRSSSIIGCHAGFALDESGYPSWCPSLPLGLLEDGRVTEQMAASVPTSIITSLPFGSRLLAGVQRKAAIRLVV